MKYFRGVLFLGGRYACPWVTVLHIEEGQGQIQDFLMEGG